MLYPYDSYNGTLEHLRKRSNLPNKDELLRREEESEEFRFLRLMVKLDELTASETLRKKEWEEAALKLQTAITPSWGKLIGFYERSYERSDRSDMFYEARKKYALSEVLANERTESLLRAMLDSDFAITLKNLMTARDQAKLTYDNAQEECDQYRNMIEGETNKAGGSTAVDERIIFREKALWALMAPES